MRLEIFSDVICPWCYIGKRRFDRAVANLTSSGIELNLEVVYRPFQLDPTAPQDTPTPVREAYAKKFGGNERADEILTHVTKIAATEGIDFNLDIALRANTSRAHRLIALCQTTALDHTKLKEQLMIAYFCNGKDISNIDVLTNIGINFGMNETAVVQMFKSDLSVDLLNSNLERAHELGITAVPTYVFDEQWSVPGAQDSEMFERIIRRLAEQSTSS
jgi:predicted DsbA family dithiol-disulfide isomerase